MDPPAAEAVPEEQAVAAAAPPAAEPEPAPAVEEPAAAPVEAAVSEAADESQRPAETEPEPETSAGDDDAAVAPSDNEAEEPAEEPPDEPAPRKPSSAVEPYEKPTPRAPTAADRRRMLKDLLDQEFPVCASTVTSTLACLRTTRRSTSLHTTHGCLLPPESVKCLSRLAWGGSDRPTPHTYFVFRCIFEPRTSFLRCVLIDWTLILSPCLTMHCAHDNIPHTHTLILPQLCLFVRWPLVT
jgi:hypothetical protein